MKAYRVVVLAGDGVGPEVSAAAAEVLQNTASRFGFGLELAPAALGGAAIDAHGEPLPAATLAACKNADAILLGAVGGPKWDALPPEQRPEKGLLGLRKALGLYANLRPIVPHAAVIGAAPLRPELLEDVDILFVRELTGGLYFGPRELNDDSAFDTCEYTVAEIERVVRFAARAAQKRRGKLTSVDKANVLATSRLWRATVERVCGEEFPDLEVEHLLVDAAAMHLLSRARDFDVIVTENLFGDILTDEASMLCGSMGLLPSASLCEDGPGLFEPIHGSAPDIAGRGIANPIGAILSVALLLRHGLGEHRAAAAIEAAVAAALAAGHRCADLAAGAPAAPLSTAQMTAAVLAEMTVATATAQSGVA